MQQNRVVSHDKYSFISSFYPCLKTNVNFIDALHAFLDEKYTLVPSVA